MNSITLPKEFSHSGSSVSSTTTPVPVYIYATVFSSLSIIIGLIWDISWHTSIGRDGLFSPPHLGMYLGAIVSGVFSGYHVLKTSFWGSAAEKSCSIRFWGIFYGSLGALFCIWGAFTIITSAPFDDWWHNTFGLDVEILSPPHTVLLLGMVTVQFGAMISVLALSNRENKMNRRILNWCFSLSSGFLLIMIFTISSEYLDRHSMHNTLFYKISGALFPLFLVAVSVSSSTKWGATSMAGVYTAIMAVMVWTLPLFPAEPRLGPILNHITTFQAFHFPLLLIFPALAIDLLNQRLQNQNLWLKGLVTGFLFLLVFLAVQWPFGNLHMSGGPNYLLGTESWYFGGDPSYPYRYSFNPDALSTGMELLIGLLIALVFAVLSSRIGLSWGNWMKSVKR